MTTNAESTYEHHFVTLDKDDDHNDVRFGLIEDESGGIYWGYGHITAAEFVAEVNRWLRHCGVDSDELPNETTTPVEHLWAEAGDDDEFRVTTFAGAQDNPKAFPVTKLVL